MTPRVDELPVSGSVLETARGLLTEREALIQAFRWFLGAPFRIVDGLDKGTIAPLDAMHAIAKLDEEMAIWFRATREEIEEGRFPPWLMAADTRSAFRRDAPPAPGEPWRYIDPRFAHGGRQGLHEDES